MDLRKIALLVIAFMLALPLFAQEDKKDVRAGNHMFRKNNFSQAEIDYRKGLVKDSTSFASAYDLASTLYKQKDYENAGKALDRVKDQAPDSQYADRWYFNSGDVALQKKDYKAAVDAFKQALLRNPGDLEAKENYIYAKKMLENQQNQGEGEGDGQDNQDQNDQKQDQNQDQQDQNQDQQNQNQDKQDQKDQQQEQQQQQISAQQAQQMLKAIQEKEKETQEKVEKAKAEQAQTRRKENNW